MFIAIVTGAMEDDSALTINNEDDDYPAMFDNIADMQDLKDGHSLMACDWWAFDCDTGETRLLDA
ncbi:MAG: hypothetical protein GF334_06515 [Candidatus Altiarchaeales archaeon]|nr:hypothetical protein [Candidatus Altiarchaeales archaeon]